MAFELPELPYAYDALEPYIDETTMHLHHDKHHQSYLDKLNEALAKHPELEGGGIESLLSDLEGIPEDIRLAVHNQGGGYYNHNLFWESMTPETGSRPQGELSDTLDDAFGSFANFQNQFEEKGLKHFGSGWVWLIRNQTNGLEIITTANQDSPLSSGLTPLLGNDLWEHAYYLKYQNRRGEYLKAWWNLVNWKTVASRLES